MNKVMQDTPDDFIGFRRPLPDYLEIRRFLYFTISAIHILVIQWNAYLQQMAPK